MSTACILLFVHPEQAPVRRKIRLNRVGKTFYVYILFNRSRNLCIGITNELEFRVWQHRNGFSNYCSRYNIHRLVYFERFSRPGAAIAREKELKGWIRRKKITLIEVDNPTWEDLSAEWGQPIEPLRQNPPTR